MTPRSSADRPEARTPRSFRLRPGLVSRLDRRARDTGRSRGGLVERYLEEGLRMDDHPLIAFRDARAGRRAVLAGTRLDIWQVVETVRGHDGAVEEAADYLGVAPRQVRACLRYYADFRDEIDEWMAHVDDVARREEEGARRQREALG